MTQFFRYTEDAYTDINITLLRIMLLIVILLAYKIKNKQKLLKPALLLSFAGQILLFTWYVGNHNIFIKEGLPLFHCRISAIMMLVAYILRNDKLMRYFAWLGLIGAIISFAFPDPSKYLWPHVTNLTYTMNHLLLGFTGALIISSHTSHIKIKDTLMITSIMNAVIMSVNLILHTNYGYLVHFPESVPLKLSPATTFFIMSMIITSLIALSDKIQENLSHTKQEQTQVTMQE